MNAMRVPPSRGRRGFTLVEILTVIVIIGILAGIAIPAITGALRTAKEAAIRSEIDVMAQAMEAYKLEYGDYPPDFSDWDAVERHFRNAFPNIDDNELRILSQFTHYDNGMARTNASGPADPRSAPAYDHYPHAIDRAEAIVFCLGGFSSDKARPFTGQGGPLVLVAGATLGATPSGGDYLLYQYNSEREAGYFDFDQPKLSLVVYNDGNTGNGPLGATIPYVYSIEEDSARAGTAGPFNNNVLGIRYFADPFPAYSPGASERPVAYFNSRGYDRAWGAGVPTVWNPSPGFPLSHHFQAVYLPNGAIAETGVARPYATNVPDTTPPSAIQGMTVASAVLQFAENSKFQLISAGLDNNYGGIISANWGSAAGGINVYPSGNYYNPLSATSYVVDKYQDDLCLQQHFGATAPLYRLQPQLDNVTNFSTRTLGSDLP